MVNEVDVLIVGAGPAGSTVALNLASRYSVLLVDSRELDSDEAVVGESLPPVAGRLMSDMGILASFEAQGHQRCYGNRSVWGGHPASETDLLRDPDGLGWHLDRARFDRWMRESAISRGTRLLTGTSLTRLSWDGATRVWNIELANRRSGGIRLSAQLFFDATGRLASIARRLGATVVSSEQRTVCGWLIGNSSKETSSTAGFTFIEAVEDGWWYTSPLPSRKRILAFFTDPELPSARHLRSANQLLHHAERTQTLIGILQECAFSSSVERVRLNISSGGRCKPCAGPNWFAVGDAAIHFDPISSQGILNALFTGLASAEAANHILSGEDPDPAIERYCRLVDGIWDAYIGHLAVYYRSEQRWPDRPFWARRRFMGFASNSVPSESGRGFARDAGG